jgi:hypothetical protein
MTPDNIPKPPRRWPSVAMIVLLVLLPVLWVDSYFHVRHFLFVPAGDVAASLRSFEGSLQWTEYAWWEDLPNGRDYVGLSVPYWALLLCLGCFFGWYRFQKAKRQANPSDIPNPASPNSSATKPRGQEK